MGFSPQDVDRMSVWQYAAALEGYAAAHDPDAGKSLSDSEREDIWNWMKGRPN